MLYPLSYGRLRWVNYLVYCRLLGAVIAAVVRKRVLYRRLAYNGITTRARFVGFPHGVLQPTGLHVEIRGRLVGGAVSEHLLHVKERP